jgi:SAM-dependent methyltransferase
VDSNPKALDFVARQAEKAGLRNVDVVSAGRGGVVLPESMVDLVFARNVFHHLRDPESYFRSLKRALKPKGSVAIIDHAPGRGFSFVNLFRHVTPVETIHRTMESAGFRLARSLDFLPGQTFTTWSCPDPGS